MNRRFNTPLLWGAHSPFIAFTGAGLIIMASSRFAYAIICAGALLWVYGLTTLVFSNAEIIMPRRGRMIILLFLSTFLCGIFMFLAGLLNPLLIISAGYFMILIPPCCLGSGLFEACDSVDPMEAVSRSLLEAGVMAGIIIALALIREPLGMGTLSFPGGPQGIVDLFNNHDAEHFVPARILSASAGGILLFGYGTALFLYFSERNGGIPRNSELQEEDQ